MEGRRDESTLVMNMNSNQMKMNRSHKRCHMTRQWMLSTSRTMWRSSRHWVQEAAITPHHRWSQGVVWPMLLQQHHADEKAHIHMHIRIQVEEECHAHTHSHPTFTQYSHPLPLPLLAHRQLAAVELQRKHSIVTFPALKPSLPSHHPPLPLLLLLHQRMDPWPAVEEVCLHHHVRTSRCFELWSNKTRNRNDRSRNNKRKIPHPPLLPRLHHHPPRRLLSHSPLLYPYRNPVHATSSSLGACVVYSHWRRLMHSRRSPNPIDNPPSMPLSISQGSMNSSQTIHMAPPIRRRHSWN